MLQTPINVRQIMTKAYGQLTKDEMTDLLSALHDIAEQWDKVEVDPDIAYITSDFYDILVRQGVI